MATSRRPSYLKRQKEQARMARANEKRTARLERKRNGGGVEMGSLEDLGIVGPNGESMDMDMDMDIDGSDNDLDGDNDEDTDADTEH